jgi:ATP-binding cassette subfamily B protein
MNKPRSGDVGAQPGVGWRTYARRGGIIIGVLLAASPAAAALMAVLMILGGIAPTVTAWLQRSVLNSLVPATPLGGPGAGGAGHAAVGAAVGHVTAGQATHGGSTDDIVVMAVLLGVVGLVTAVIPYSRTYVQAVLRRKMGVVIQDRMFRAINSYPGLSRFESPVFHDKIRLINQLSNNTISTVVASAMTCGQSAVTAVGMFGTLYLISPVLTAIVTATSVPIIAAQVSNSRKRADLEWRKSPAVRRQLFYSRLLSDRDAAKEVRLFGLGDFLHGRMLAQLRSINRGQQLLDRRIFLAEGGLSVVGAVITGCGFVWVVHQTVAGRLSIGDVSMFTMAVIGMQSAISNLVSRLADVYQGLLLFGHYTDVVSAGPDLLLAASPAELPALRRGIELKDVWFRYDPDHPWVLRGVSLFIPHGRSVALIGLNGAGKSTLVKLLCRLYDPNRGSISWDGVDIREVAPEDLRARIGTVFQDYMAYDLSAAENIGIGDLSRLDDADRIRHAAEQAGIHEKVASLPRGYATLLSRIFFDGQDKEDPDTGVFLSGGQWQRLALARGLMRDDRDLLILDEPSAGLDAEAEHAIHQRLVAMREGRTSLLISHRLGSVRDADLIYVLSDGAVAERGTHDELMAAEGEYQRLFSLQASGYLGAGDAAGPRWRPAGGGRPARRPGAQLLRGAE